LFQDFVLLTKHQNNFFHFLFSGAP